MPRGYRLSLLAVAAVLAAPAVATAAGPSQVRGPDGRLIANGGAGSFRYPAAGGALVRVGHESASAARGVVLRDVSLLGGHVRVRRLTVPAHGLQGAVVEGLVVGGTPVPARPNTLVPLGGRSYLVALQEAVTPSGTSAVGVGVVGLRVHLGVSVAGLPAGSELWLGPASAARTAGSRARRPRAGRPGWTVLGLERDPSPPPELLTFAGMPSAAPPFSTASGPALGLEAAALAQSVLGTPYVWGGADPLSGFDCSGLTMWVYARLGVPLPHYAASQFRLGRRLFASEVRAGDLVFFRPEADGPGHVGLYVGAGRFVEAQRTGIPVRLASFAEAGASRTYLGAVRPYGG